LKPHFDATREDIARVTRRQLLGGALSLGAGVALTGAAGNALAAMAPPRPNAKVTTPVVAINDPRQFKILLVTDIHLVYEERYGNAWDARSRIAAIATMVARCRPDLIVNAGDFWSSESGSVNGDTCKRACDAFATFNTPWAFAWGNHDEAVDYNAAHATIEASPYALYCGAADGNYRVAINAKGNSQPVWNLILLNNSRGGMMQEQVDWFRAEAEAIRKKTSVPPPAFLFFHIPLIQTEGIGMPGKAVGVKLEPGGHLGSRSAFSVFRDAGFVRALFCGHDHLNDYYGTIDGVRLEYGRAAGGYGESRLRKGAKLITVDTVKKTFATKTVFPDGSSVTFDRFWTAVP
jgi:hypothetical protein